MISFLFYEEREEINEEREEREESEAEERIGRKESGV